MGQCGLNHIIGPVSIPTKNEQWYNDKKIKITQIATGRYHSLALTDDGRIWFWGDNECAQGGYLNRMDWNCVDITFSPVPSLIDSFNNVKIKHIKSGGFHSYARTKDDIHHIWGSNKYNQCITVNKEDIVLPPHIVELKSVTVLKQMEIKQIKGKILGIVLACYSTYIIIDQRGEFRSDKYQQIEHQIQ